MHPFPHMTLNAKVSTSSPDPARRPHWLVEEVGHVHPQRVRDVHEVAQLHLVAGLHPLDGAAVELGLVRQRLLGHVHVQAPHADAVADGPTGVEDPRGLFCWHPPNGLSIMIVSQQQI